MFPTLVVLSCVVVGAGSWLVGGCRVSFPVWYSTGWRWWLHGRGWDVGCFSQLAGTRRGCGCGFGVLVSGSCVCAFWVSVLGYSTGMAVVWPGVVRGLAWFLALAVGEGPPALRAGVLVEAICVGCVLGRVQLGVPAGVTCGVRLVAVPGGKWRCLGGVVLASGWWACWARWLYWAGWLLRLVLICWWSPGGAWLGNLCWWRLRAMGSWRLRRSPGGCPSASGVWWRRAALGSPCRGRCACPGGWFAGG